MSAERESVYGVVNALPCIEATLKSGDVVKFADMLALYFDYVSEEKVLCLPMSQCDRHEDFLDVQRALVKMDEILSCFERMYKDGRWDCDHPWSMFKWDDDNYDEIVQSGAKMYGGNEQRGPSKDARRGFVWFEKVQRQLEEASRLVFVRNEKWLTWTRAADAPDAYLQEALASGAVRVCRRDDPSLVFGAGGCGPTYRLRAGVTYDVSGWDAFVCMFYRLRMFGCESPPTDSDLMRLTDVHQEVADLLLAVGTKNQDPNAPVFYYVRMEWVTDRFCKVAGTDVDVFRPKKRAKLVRKSREPVYAPYYDDAI